MMEENISNKKSHEEILNGGKPTKLLRRRPWYRINFRMIPCKTTYVMVVGKDTTFRMNFILFCLSIGLTKSQAGLIAGLRSIGIMFGAPFWGIVSDRYKCHRTIISFVSVVAVACTSLHPLIAYYLGNPNTNVCKPQLTTLNSSLVLNMSSLNSTLIGNEIPNNFTKEDQTRLFFVLFAIMLFQAFFDGGLEACIDLGVMERIKQVNIEEGGQFHKFGFNRVWGALGNMGPILGNLAVDYFPSGNLTCYTGTYIITVVMMILYCVSLITLFTGLTFQDETTSDNTSSEERNGNRDTQSLMKLFLRIFSKVDFALFTIVLLVLGIMLTNLLVFTFPYMKDMGSTTSEMNAVIIVATVSGCVGYLTGDKIIRIIGGNWQALALSCISFFARFFGMALTRSSIVIVVVQVFHAFALPISETASVHYVQDNTPQAILGIMYGVVNAVQFSLSDVVGSSIGGIIYEDHGAATLFMISSFVCLFVFIFSIVYLIQTKAFKFPTSGNDLEPAETELERLNNV